MSSSTMALARAFTKRSKRNNEPQSPPSRANTVRYAPGTIKRNLISLPTELISTTNVHALTAPDIRKGSSTSSSSSTHSSNDSDFSTIDRSFLSRAGTDASSIDSSPSTPSTPPMDDIKSFFDVKAIETPAIPQRAPSHSKKAHVELSRKRSIQRLSPPPTSLGNPSVRNSFDMFGSSAADAFHPFGRELAQVNEVAEEFGASALLEEEQEMLNKGLCKFRVEDYLDEIAMLYGGVFEDRLGPNPWI